MNNNGICFNCVHEGVCMGKASGMTSCTLFYDKERNVYLPCKAGDSVYYVTRLKNIDEYTVIGIKVKVFEKRKEFYLKLKNKADGSYEQLNANIIGKYLFFDEKKARRVAGKK